MGEDEDWRPIETAVVDGTLCDLRYRDRFGAYTVTGPLFLYDDGHWYCVAPPRQLQIQPVAWRPMRENPTP